MGDRVNLYPAQSGIVNGRICVFIKAADIVKDENILRVAIWSYSESRYVYEKSYAIAPQPLEAGKCIPGVGEFKFIPAEDYGVVVETPLHAYEARFSVLQQGERIVLK